MSTTRASGSVELVVAKGKRAMARVVARYDDGQLREVAAADAEALLEPPADVTLTLSPDDATSVCDGALDLTVAFMRGTMKMTGDFGVLLAVLPITRGAEHRAAFATALTSALTSAR